jgi:hypothetical protein
LSTLFVLIVGLATLALKNNCGVRYWLWTVASIKFLLPLSVLVSVGERMQWHTAPAVVQPAVSFVMEGIFLVPAALAASTPVVSSSVPIFPWLLAAAWGTRSRPDRLVATVAGGCLPTSCPS